MIGPFSTDSYIPNLPEMVDDLRTTNLMAGLTIQLNWIVKGFANILLGRLSDFVGRKPVILVSFVIYIASTAACSLAPNVYWLLLARILQAVGEANAVIASAIARDVLDDPTERMR